MSGLIDLLSAIPAKMFQKAQRKLAKTEKQNLTSEQSILKNQVRQSYFLQTQFWVLFGGMLIHVLLVIFTY
jgi:hypothetical protein